MECNTAYGGSRASTAMHRQQAKDNGLLDVAELDILDEDVDEAVQMAIESDEPIRDWKAAFIGQPFDGDKFVDAIEERL